ncbi:ABC transporter ATP-binding protein [Flavobacterium ardleyense]|uniref:ABC transporter ATP-binding protein n=1 Tax=Flavobacterium ardleyense TaxID=2038737 RepID=UPI00298BE1B9|nr:ATP-binding cassette domain-containing protein [Flavobacterium ardleyense]
METILSVRELSKNFGRLQAVKSVSVEIQKGNVYGILGPNGSGKSTTLGVLLNVINKSSGSFEWFGNTMSTTDALKKIGAIIERPNFYPYMTAAENLELVCKIKNCNTDNITRTLTLVGLEDRRNDKFAQFSLGMKQRLAIASALLNNPEILILDEPTNGLDPQGIHQIRDIIKSIAAQGTTILLASHLLDEVEKVCSHVMIMRKGEMIFSGSVNQISTNEGFFELSSADNLLLMEVLKKHFAVDKAEISDSRVLVYLNTPLAAEDLNKYLATQSIYLNHLIFRKNTLEEQFLEITQ